MKTITLNNKSWDIINSSVSKQHIIKWTQRTFYTRNYNFEEEYDNPEAELGIRTENKTYSGELSGIAKSIDQHGSLVKVKLKGTSKQYPLLSALQIKKYANFLMLTLPLEEDILIGEQNGVIESKDAGISIIFKLSQS